MAHPLDDPRAKIRRAEYHLGQLREEWKTWIQSHPYLPLPYSNRDDKTIWQWHVHRFDEAVKPESDVFGLLIGDYVHNLRSALDQLVWRLVTDANRRTVKAGKEREIVFPIVRQFGHPRDFWALDPVKYLTLEQGLFFEGFQPYRGRNTENALADLHTLWNADKHRLITPLCVRVADEGPIFKFTDCREVEKWVNQGIALQGDTKVACLKVEITGPNPEVNVERIPTEVTFGEIERPIRNIETLRDVANDIVEGCAKFFE